MVGAQGRGRAAVFLDRDGVLVVPTFRDGRSFAPTELRTYCFYPEARESLERLKAEGFMLIVVTNQPDVASGLISREVIDIMHRRLSEELPVDAVLACFHAAGDNCPCRKPRPGMLLEAAEHYGISLGASFMVGDRASDIEAGIRAGCRSVFIDLGYTAEARPQGAAAQVKSIRQAADVILAMAATQLGEGEKRDAASRRP
jgi:D-glycero-D-manno-heptose 1,7-bisphosphate phosphatase